MKGDGSGELLVMLAIMACLFILPFFVNAKSKKDADGGGGMDGGHHGHDGGCDGGDGGGD